MAGGGRGDGGGSEGDLRSGASLLPGEVHHPGRHFDDFFSEFRLTEYERRELVYFLAAYRYRKTIETLL